GFALPREIGLGVAFEPSSRWLLSFELNWINWADAVKTVTLRATRPANAAAPGVYELVAPADWRNQWVFATGLAYRPDRQTTYYAGHNYGKSPIPEKNASPLLAGHLEHHLTLGAAKRLGPEWTLTGGIEYLLPVKANYSSPLFGEAELRNEAVFLHVMLGRRW
ncbi:MAG: outer membrane protein transport protein, partial [Novosphingobium sp.]|nr:outer membrane protein transport protein [Novosphingobium sp.]